MKLSFIYKTILVYAHLPLTVPLKIKLPPSRETPLVYLETRLIFSRRVSFLTSALEVPILGISQYVCIVSYWLSRKTQFSFSSALHVYHVCIINFQVSINIVSYTLPKPFLFKSDLLVRNVCGRERKQRKKAPGGQKHSKGLIIKPWLTSYSH